ncbi:MAG: hypothetical protein AUI50_05705 [Crenarchaeota archaeon 13_1_40CM_2_52_14]|nr:MAG: hypothetical protein AUI50_05705 [Crenarchaeota archaeon 13_1_40CM_2_52_14]
MKPFHAPLGKMFFFQAGRGASFEFGTPRSTPIRAEKLLKLPQAEFLLDALKKSPIISPGPGSKSRFSRPPFSTLIRRGFHGGQQG